MRKIKGFGGMIRTKIHLNALMIKPHKRIAKRPMAHGRTASAKIQSVAIMHAGTIGPESARNMPPAKNHLASPNNKPHAILLAHGLGQHVFAKMVVNGIQKLECVAHHHLQSTHRQPAHNLIRGHSTWSNDKKKNQQP